MISVTIYKNRNFYYSGFSIKGHAGYDKYGKDIVCSSVSILVINTINSIEKFTETRFKIDEDQNTGYIRLDFIDTPSKEASLLVDSMVLGISEIQKQYGSYVTLKIKEV